MTSLREGKFTRERPEIDVLRLRVVVMVEEDVGARTKARVLSDVPVELGAELDAVGLHALGVVAAPGERVVDSERERRAQVAAGHGVVPAEIGAMELRAEERLIRSIR